jgi:hypothetical protein
MLENLENTLFILGETLVDDAKRNLKKEKKIVSGVLFKSLDYKIEKDFDDDFILRFSAVDYAQYVDQGVKGANPKYKKGGIQKAPRSPFKFGSGRGKGSLFKSLDKWIVRKKDIAPRDKKGRFMSREQIKHLFARSIYNQGIEPTMFLTRAWEKMLKDGEPLLEKGLIKDIEKLFIELKRD